MTTSINQQDYKVSVNTTTQLVTISAVGPAGVGIPAGGSTGQTLQKVDGTNYNTQWSDAGSGTVTQVVAGAGLSGGTITSSGTISLPNSGVSAGAYTNANITVDAQGRVTVAASGTAGGVTSLTGGNLIDVDASTGAITIDHAAKGGSGVATAYPGSITVDSFGHVVSTGATSTPALPANNLSDLANAGTARTNLGLGSSATLDVPSSGDAASGEVVKGNDTRLTDARTPVAHSAALITSGTLAIAQGGTGSATAPMVGVITAADAAAARTVLSLGTAATSATGDFEASGSIATHNAVTTAHGISAFGSTLVDDADAATARTTLGAAASNHTHTLANITDAGTAAASATTDFVASTDVSAFGGTLIDDADAATARTTLGLGTASTVNTGTSAGNIVVLDGSAKLPAVDGSQLTNVAGSGGGSDWHGQDPTDTGVIRIFDDFLGGNPSWAFLGTSGSYFEDGWEFDDAGASASGYLKWRTSTSAYSRNSISLSQILNPSPADGTEAMWEVRAKSKWNASSVDPYFSVTAFCPKSDLSPTTTEPSGGYGDTAKFFVLHQKGDSYIRTGGYDNEGSNGNPTLTDTDVAPANDTWVRLGIHIKYVAASSAWRCQAYVNGVAKNSTFDLTTGTQAPTFGFWAYNNGQGHVNEGIVDWMSLQYTRPLTISYVNIDDI